MSQGLLVVRVFSKRQQPTPGSVCTMAWQLDR
jgi:hypothetical protein